jgi:uncharacterized membrane protein
MKQELAEKNISKKKLKLKSKLGCLSIIFGIISLLTTVREFNYSIFQFKYFILTLIGIGTMIQVVQCLYFNDPILDKETIWKVLLFGSISMTVIFYCNKWLSKESTYTKTFSIVQRELIEGKQDHFSVIIQYDDYLQEINVPNNEKREIENADSIKLYLKQGVFKIQTIERTELK